MTKRLTLILSGLLVLLAVTGAWLHVRWTRTPLSLARPTVVIDIPAGASLRRVAVELKSSGVIGYPREFEWYVRLHGNAPNIRAGEYAVTRGTTLHGLVSLLVSGEVIQHELTLVEGWTFAEMMRAVEADPYLAHTLSGAGAKHVMSVLGHPGQAAEGRFFPDTYKFPKGTRDIDFLRRAYATMRTHLREAWAGRASGLPLADPYQALVLASIVEKETAVPAERPEIAGVFVRRLQKHMRLQSDPTVIYGLGRSYTGDITFKDLKLDTPYNTYTRNGLPPTPICLPGLASLRAVLHPASGDALYFVAKGDGSHHFSATLEEHNAAVRRYQLKHDGN